MRKNLRFVGMDVHKDSISVAVAESQYVASSKRRFQSALSLIEPCRLPLDAKCTTAAISSAPASEPAVSDSCFRAAAPGIVDKA